MDLAPKWLTKDSKLKLKTEKKWGQHFLHDQSTIKKILSDAPSSVQAIFEIGPGAGALTVPLKKLNLPFLAMDIDPRVKEHHQELLSAEELIIEDAMVGDLNHILEKRFSGLQNIWLVSNLPYNVSSQLLVKFLPLSNISHMTLMFQKEVAQKVLLKENEKLLAGSLGTLTQAYFEVQKLLKVAPGSFSPPPKVESMVLSFRRRETPLVSFDKMRAYEIFLRNLFSSPRKQIQSFWNHFWPRHTCPLVQLGLRADLRAEKLQLQEVIQIFEFTQTPPSA